MNRDQIAQLRAIATGERPRVHFHRLRFYARGWVRVTGQRGQHGRVVVSVALSAEAYREIGVDRPFPDEEREIILVSDEVEVAVGDAIGA
jgi:hypothetical protein